MVTLIPLLQLFQDTLGHFYLEGRKHHHQQKKHIKIGRTFCSGQLHLRPALIVLDILISIHWRKLMCKPTSPAPS